MKIDTDDIIFAAVRKDGQIGITIGKAGLMELNHCETTLRHMLNKMRAGMDIQAELAKKKNNRIIQPGTI